MLAVRLLQLDLPFEADAKPYCPKTRARWKYMTAPDFL
jgi:hypothetical protein